MKGKALKKYHDSIEEITKIFLREYFDDYEYDKEDWVGREIGGIINIADFWLNFDRIKEAVELNAPKKLFFDYYYLELEGEKPKVNFKNYVKYYKGFAK